MLDLSELRRLLLGEFSQAELSVRGSAGRSLPQVQELEVTALFTVEVERRLAKASSEGRIARAVQTDLTRWFQREGVAPPSCLPQVTNGLIARVLRHGPVEEARAGGDFGLLVVEPLFIFRWGHHLDLQRGGRKRGILVQAKRRLHGGRWNRLTARQKTVLRRRMSYAALLRYEFEDVSNTELKDFRWNLLANADVSDVIEWLRSGEFPDSVDTSDLIAGLSMGRYGTADPQSIERDICPSAGAFVIVEVDWREGEDPGPALSRLNRELMGTRRLREEVRHRLGR